MLLLTCLSFIVALQTVAICKSGVQNIRSIELLGLLLTDVHSQHLTVQKLYYNDQRLFQY